MSAIAPPQVQEPPDPLTSTEVGQPLWWLRVLELRLMARQHTMQRLDRYYRGRHDLPFLTHAHRDKVQKEFMRLLEESKSNFMRLVVDTTVERLRAEGFRLSASSDATVDKESWDIWQANCMDAQSQTAFVEALVKGVSYLSVWFDEDQDGYADIAVEDPTQTIVAYEGGSHYRRRAAGLKVWLDDIRSVRRANVYLPDAIYKFEAQSDTVPIQTPTAVQQAQIPWAAVDDEEAIVENPLGIVPIVPLRNHPRLLTEGESEIEDVIPIQNQINGLAFLLALAGYFGAHRQRFVSGIKFVDDAKGNPQEPFDAAIDRIWGTENPDAKFGEFSQTDLTQYIKAIEQKVLHIAVTTRTPRHYLIEQGQSPSGDAIKSAESGLVQKVEQKQLVFGEGLEEAIRLARRFQNLDAGEEDVPVDSEIVWADPQSQTLGVLVDATVKEYIAGLVPLPLALERIGYSQIEITKILEMKTAQPDMFAPSPTADPTVKSAMSSDVLRNLPKGA